MKNRKKILVTLLSAVLLAGSIAVPAEAASNDYKVSRVGEKSKTVYVGKELELKVKKLGAKKVKDSQLKWTIKDTSILQFDDNDRYDDEVELKAKKAGKTTVTCKNLATGGKLTYTITVKKSSQTISRIGNATRTEYVGDKFELAVKKNGGISDNKIHWSIKDTSIIGFADDDRYDDDIELKAKKAGTTKIYAKNLITGNKISYTITVKKASGTNTISRIGDKTKTVRLGDDIELEVKKGSKLKNNQIKWTISDTSILKFDDGERIGTEVELDAKKIGTTKVTAKNLATGKKIVYTVKVVR